MPDPQEEVGRRDRVWDAVLRALSTSPATIRKADVKRLLDGPVSDRTISRAMHAMRGLGWLQQDSEGSHQWFPGPRAREHLEVYNLGEESPGAEDLERILEDTEPEKLRAAVLDQIDEFANEADIPGSGDRAAERRNAIRLVIAEICREGQAEASQLRAQYYPEHAGDYETEEGWWTNLIYPALKECDLVKTEGTGTRTWERVPD